MKNKKWIAIPIAALCVIVAAVVGIFLYMQFSIKISEAENTYAPEYKSFCTSPQSAEITIDGKLEEEAWEGKGWFTDTYLQNTTGVMPGWKITGFPTEYGIYLAAVAEDHNLVNDGEHTMAKNSSFGFYVEVDNAGEKHANDILYATKVTIDMRGDAHCSEGNNFDRAVVVEGELNSRQTQRATAEIFLPWDFLQVDVSKGIPAEFRLYPVYRGVFEGEDWGTDMILPIGSAEYDIYNYWRFNQDGYMTPDREDAKLGDTVTGVAKTGNWDISREQEGIVRSSYGTEHHVIFDKEHYESDFIAEVTMIPVQSLENEWPKAGFYFLNTKGEWHAILQDTRKDLLVDAVDGTKNVNKLSLASVDQTWNWMEYEKEAIENPNAAETKGVNLKVVKYDGCFWYFVNDQYITVEKKDFMDTEVFPGFYALGMDVIYQDYSYTSIEDMDALKAYLNARGIYIIDARAVTPGGKVEASAISVKMGDQYDITITCDSGYEVSSILVNDEEKLEDAKRNAKDGVYTLTASDGNQEIRVSFQKCDGLELTGYVLSEEDESTLNAEMILTEKGNRILRYQILSNSKKGYTAVMPKGSYKAYVTSDGYIEAQESVSLDEDQERNFLLKLSLFAKEVEINGTKVYSNMSVWDMSKEGKGVVSTSYDAGGKMQPLYFAKTGKEALFQAKMEYTTRFEAGKEYQPDLFGGLFVTDGKNSGYILAVQNKLLYGNWQWTDVVIPGPVLMYPDPVPAEMAVALQDGYFYVYINDNFAAKLRAAEVVPGCSQNAEFAYGIYMIADKTADIAFRDVSFSTDSEEVANFQIQQGKTAVWKENNMFARAVVINGVRKASAREVWDTSEIAENILKGSYDMGTKMQPFYFASTGKQALYQAKIEYTTSFEAGKEYQNDLYGGLYVTDGTHNGYILAVQNKLVYGDWQWTGCPGLTRSGFSNACGLP
ncbi:MAG: hypothetical protein HFH87_07635 [Lachnospiraceae bacterium]|nr:hypothetical protein [Lachnospiraceae bacterium]